MILPPVPCFCFLIATVAPTPDSSIVKPLPKVFVASLNSSFTRNTKAIFVKSPGPGFKTSYCKIVRGASVEFFEAPRSILVTRPVDGEVNCVMQKRYIPLRNANTVITTLKICPISVRFERKLWIFEIGELDSFDELVSWSSLIFNCQAHKIALQDMLLRTG
ncbi:hypothetical protein Pan110_48360 [Gimesia panareensis]|nr:hypothetical protein Pan110_48360 [Gimesia panareensis]